MTSLITGQEYEPDDEEPIGTPDGEKTRGRWEEHRGQPIRAIVKELVEDDDFEEAFKAGRISAGTMWRDLEGLHALDILVRDIHLGNYIGGKLVDLSRAWAMYHPGLDQISRHSLARLRMLDTHDLLVILQDCWIATLIVDELDVPESFERCEAGENDF